MNQTGGSHYSAMSIQPIDYIEANQLGFCEGNVIKYVSRYRSKGGLQDLLKARDYLDRLISNYPDSTEIIIPDVEIGIRKSI